ncbi:MAG TPA: hypothetical protein VGQ41_08865 [Pyrinomonadaceae bacterium]|jgi:hypothetical protein|nr:hypothetical protein [Pyrinomonadaceae bacterium]
MQGTKSGESGAALLTVLMLSTLLLAAGGTLILVSTMTGRTAIDSTAEMQAFYGAEGGLQATLNVLRGNVTPVSGMPTGSKISFRNAITLSTSNLPSDSSASPRLSGWLNYDYTPVGASVADRVSLTSSYSPQNGIAFSVEVSDPDNTPVASGEPARLRLRVTGYGPKDAVKKLELVVKRTNFDYDPVATIMMRSSDDGSPLTFTTGDSSAREYSGHDHDGTSVLPAFASNTNGDMSIEFDAATKNTVTEPIAANVSTSALPAWLQSAGEARAFVTTQKANAISQSRYFNSFNGYAGSASAPAFTFVDGDCVLDGGAGLLIVTGNLELNGNPGFDGLILVLGGGTLNRDGGGNGNIYGAITVAKFDQNGTGGFLAPSFTTNGAGTSTIQYDSTAVRKALNLAGPLVQGVREF